MSRHINGTVFPEYSTRKDYATAFGMSIDEFEFGWRGGRPIPTTPGGFGIPVINRAPAGNVIDYEECGVDTGQGRVYIDRDNIADPNAFAVIVTGDSMVGLLNDGDYAIFIPVNPDGKTQNGRSAVEDGEAVFVRFSENGPVSGCTIALFYRLGDGRIELKKKNEKYSPRYTKPELIANLSVLVQSRRNHRKGMVVERAGYVTDSKSVPSGNIAQPFPNYENGDA